MRGRELLGGRAACSLLAVASLGLSAHALDYDITLTNLSSAQPFSPPVFATHDASVHLWQFGQTASEGIQHIAEKGNRSFLVGALNPLVDGSVRNLVTPLASPLLPGQSVTVRVSVNAAHPLLSGAWMLGRTNDGFSGQDSLNLFGLTGTHVFDLIGYDAGTELNNEALGFLGAMGGGNARDVETGVVTQPPGILGIADAPIAWNWANPVARVTVTSAAPEPASRSLLALAAAPLGFVLRRRRAA